MTQLVKRSVRTEEPTTDDHVEDVKASIEEGQSREEDELLSNDTADLMPTGNTLLNCACSDNPFGGYALGKVAMIVGESHTGKSILILSAIAEVCKLSRFDDYQLHYDDAEFAFGFNAKKLFGERFTKRVIYGEEHASNTVSDFYGNITHYLDSGKPFIYVLDTYDALTDEAELLRAEIARKKVMGEKLTKKEEQSKGGYKTEKVRKFAEVFRRCRAELKQTNSVFIVVFQTIDAINSQFVEKTRRGGNAPKFFASHEVWLSQMGKPFVSKELEIGANTLAKVKKSKITGKKRIVSFPVFYDYGVDDIRTNIEFLVEQDVFGKSKQSIIAPQIGIEKASMPKLIDHIERKNLEDELKRLVGKAWNDREESVKLDRKPRF